MGSKYHILICVPKPNAELAPRGAGLTGRVQKEKMK